MCSLVGLFIVYLVSSSMAKRTRCLLILLCELHFAVLYLLQLDYISSAITKYEASMKPILFVLGEIQKPLHRHLEFHY